MAESVGLRLNDPRFWDEDDLKGEIARIFDICLGCRLCFKFCGSFPRLFELIDAKTERLRKDYLEAHPEIVEAARRREIPVRRLNDGSLVRLGIGAKQRRILAAETDGTSAIAESIAQDKELTRCLLAEAGIPVAQGKPVVSVGFSGAMR